MKNIQHTAVSLVFIGVVQNIFYILLLLGIREGRTRLNWLFAALLIAVSTGFISVLGILMNVGQHQSSFFRVMMAVSLSCIPLLFIYVKSLMSEESHFSPVMLFHFLPVVLVFSALLIFCRPSYDLSALFTRSSLNHISVIMAIWLLYILPYLFSIYQMLKNYRRVMAESYCAIGRISRSIIYKFRVYIWIRSLLVACTVFWILNFISFLYRDIEEFYALITFVSTTMIYVLGFIGIKKPELFFASSYWNPEEKEEGGDLCE